jgi:hypothetical protein
VPRRTGDPTAHAALGGYTRADFRCVACGKLAERDQDGERPGGWYRVHLSGPFNDETDVHPGNYCSKECLLVVVLGRFGLTRAQVTEWLAGEPVPTGG